MAGQEKVRLSRFTKNRSETLCPSDDALGQEPKAWLPTDLGPGSDSVARSLVPRFPNCVW